jgi:hypothetical protein
MWPGSHFVSWSGLDRKEWRDTGWEPTRGINCMTKPEAFEIAFDLRKKRILGAI